jgi:hypothetical protein
MPSPVRRSVVIGTSTESAMFTDVSGNETRRSLMAIEPDVAAKLRESTTATVVVPRAIAVRSPVVLLIVATEGLVLVQE